MAKDVSLAQHGQHGLPASRMMIICAIPSNTLPDDPLH